MLSITFQVQVYEIAHEEMPKSFVLNGAKEVTAEQIQKLLGLGPRSAQQSQPQQPSLTGNR
jgi:hypothetical protein